MVQSREICPGLIKRQGMGTKKGTVSFSNPWTIWACLPFVAGATVKARYAAPTREDCMASTISVAFSTSWPSIIMNYNAGLDRCHLTRSLIFALLDHENLYYYSINAPLNFPCSASGKPIPRSKNSFTTTLSRPELLISTNIPPPPPTKESKRSPKYSLDPPHPFVKKNYALSSLDKTRSWIYQTIAVHPTSNLSFSRRGHVSSCCKINSTPATDTVN